jgi:hypothetical protein
MVACIPHTLNHHSIFSIIDKYTSIAESASPIEDIYAFWKSKETSLGRLVTVAKQLLPAPGTSSSCERDFSYTTLFTEARKANTSPLLLNSKLILAANMELINCFDPIDV